MIQEIWVKKSSESFKFTRIIGPPRSYYKRYKENPYHVNEDIYEVFLPQGIFFARKTSILGAYDHVRDTFEKIPILVTIDDSSMIRELKTL